MTGRAVDVAFREGIHDQPLEQVQKLILEAIDEEIAALEAQRDQHYKSAQETVERLQDVHTKLGELAGQYRELQKALKSSAKSEHQGPSFSFRRRTLGVVTALLCWWAVCSLLQPFMPGSAIDAQRVRVVLSLLCTIGALSLLLGFTRRWWRARKPFAPDRQEPMGTGYWVLGGLTLVLAAYLAFTPASAWPFAALAVAAAGVTVLSWLTLEWNQTAHLGEYLRKDRDRVLALEREWQKLSASLATYARQLVDLEGRRAQADQELEALSRRRSQTSRSMTEAYHLGRMIRAASE